MVEERAPAKVNLALHVTGRRADGYHLLDSIVAFADTGDVVRLERADDFGLEITGPTAEGLPADDTNLALRAARMMVEARPQSFGPVHIRLEKNLPVASGIGGGSADAAAVMRAMIRLFEATLPEEERHALALSLGADVPVCLEGRACRMRGIGETVEPLEGFPELHGVLANPGVPVSTSAVFAALGLKPDSRRENERPLGAVAAAALNGSADEVLDALAGAENDLQPPACRLHPEIADCLKALAEAPGVRLARMSGSGGTCFALAGSAAEADALCHTLRSACPGWWVEAVRLGGGEGLPKVMEGKKSLSG